MTDVPATDEYAIDSVTNALRVLVMLRDEPALGVVEIARRLGVARSTAHRLLSTLKREHFVEQEGDYAKYHLGPALRSFNPLATHRRTLIAHARPHLERLADETGETCQLNVLEGQNVRFIDGAEGPNPLRVVTRIGTRLPANSSAGGKAQLAAMPVEKVRALFSVGLAALTPQTIVDIDALVSELATVRRLGYAINLGESIAGMHVLGAAVLDAHRNPVAAITVAGPGNRMDPSRMEAMVAPLLKAARIVGDSA